MNNFDSLLNTVCDIETRSITQSSTTGQKVVTWTNKYRNIACRLDQASGGERYGEQQKLSFATHILFIGISYSIAVTDRIKIGTGYYDILNVANAGGHSHHQELSLQVVA